MSQHDLDIANQTFPNTRSDLNNALQALGSTSSGATAPSTTYANQLWYDTANNKLYIRNEDNDANIEICELDQTNDTVEFFKSDSVRTTLIEYSDGTDAITIASNGNVTCSGTCSATTFSGSGASLTGVLNDVVDDTTPQLGGDLDLNSNNITGTGNMYFTGNVGLDSTDYITWSNNAHTSFFVNGNEEARLEADGDFHADGDVIAFSTTISDVALKSDIEMIPNALDKIDEVRGVTFTRHNGQKSAGIIAQELEKVLPEAVREKRLALVDGKTYKTVEYDAIHGLLINCIKELKSQIEELKDGITK